MARQMFNRLSAALEKRLPEQRLFLKSDDGMRFIRLRPMTQGAILLGMTAILGWTVIITAIFLIDTISAGSAREQAERENIAYQNRLNALSHAVDLRTAEAVQAQQRFSTAMDQVAVMQVRLLDAEERRRELEAAVDVIQTRLRNITQDRDTARAALAELRDSMQADTSTNETALARDADLRRAIDVLAQALETTSGQRDDATDLVASATQSIADMEHALALAQERQERVFQQIEDAVAMSMEPLDRLLSSSGIPTDRLIGQMRASYSGQGGPLMPIAVSTMGGGEPDPVSLRANELLEKLDALNLRRMAAETLPFSMPVRGAFRHTSGFGYRRDPFNGGRRLHAGVDFAGARGTDIVAAGDGTVITAGRHSGYGLMVEIDHGFGIVTRYAHLTRLNVRAGERVSRGEHIGDMGCTGRCTGTHLHYEVRRNGDPVNPMTFITAGRDVF
ncbi:peptidoglycan DD-metalloendopeptidase family protein [Rhodobacterales bacterium LSUCC0031]|nr:peptidoglycan DD-metalloendopeptidase family protein [Rhodobacterales bacterium LSUCC0031]